MTAAYNNVVKSWLMTAAWLQYPNQNLTNVPFASAIFTSVTDSQSFVP
jgi:hypothetical protein